jgi:hypothetical protein
MPPCVPPGAHVRISSSAAMSKVSSPRRSICPSPLRRLSRQGARSRPARVLRSGISRIVPCSMAVKPSSPLGVTSKARPPPTSTRRRSPSTHVSCPWPNTSKHGPWSPTMSRSISIAASLASSSPLPSQSPEAATPSLAIQSYMLAASISSVTILKLCGVSTTKPPRPCPLLRNGDCAASSPAIVGARENMA